VAFARLALFVYAVTMCGTIAIVNAQEQAPETAISYGVLAIVAAGLGISLGPGRNWARVAAWIFSGMGMLYSAFLGLATIEESKPLDVRDPGGMTPFWPSHHRPSSRRRRCDRGGSCACR